MYIQQFLFHVWVEKVIPPSLELINELELKILRNSHNEFLNLWDSLTVNQKKTLKLIIRTSSKDMFYASSVPSKPGEIPTNPNIARVFKDFEVGSISIASRFHNQ